MTDNVSQIIDERAATHGDPVFTHVRIAQVWSAILDHEVTAFEVALCMAGLKLVRAQNNPDHQDSRDDAQGYVRIADLVMGEQETEMARRFRHKLGLIQEAKAEAQAAMQELDGSSMSSTPTHVVGVHNHPPFRPPCNERITPAGIRRGGCLNDDGSER